MDFTPIITAQAIADGIPAALALAVAKQESDGQQSYADGTVKISQAGAIGIFQLMPATAADLGVNPYDATDNIRGGVRFLADQVRQFGLPAGLWAYNWGPANAQAALAGRISVPLSVQRYADQVMANAGLKNSGDISQPATGSGPGLLIIGAGLGFLVLVAALS